MQAVADSNLDKMASLWGTTNGPALKTHQPPDYEKRIAIMQAYLRNDGFHITSDVAEGETRRAVQVQIRRVTCTWNVPFETVCAPNRVCVNDTSRIPTRTSGCIAPGKYTFCCAENSV